VALRPAAIIANLHDVVIILGCFALFQWNSRCRCWPRCWRCWLPVNESVVVFDRVRENARCAKPGSKSSTARLPR
jgi:preprotein translocase subunit SecF